MNSINSLQIPPIVVNYAEQLNGSTLPVHLKENFYRDLSLIRDYCSQELAKFDKNRLKAETFKRKR